MRICKIFIWILLGSFYAQGQIFSTEIKRVVFLGNSITYSGEFVQILEAYQRINFPNQSIEIINLGLPSETISGLSEVGHAGGRFARPDLHDRLARILNQTKPDLVFATYGINDGIYMPFEESRFNKFKEGVSWLHDMVEASGATIIHITPSVFEEKKEINTGYDQVMDRYSKWLIEQKGWRVIDTHFPLKNELSNRKKTDPRFTLATDGVHPGELGHWLIAKQILLYLGANDVQKFQSKQDILVSKKDPDNYWKVLVGRHNLIKDAWLTFIGHKRPEMKIGMDLVEAVDKSKVIDQQLKEWK